VTAVALTCRLVVGVDIPTPTFPLASTVNSDVPDEEATLNGLTAGAPCTLKEYDDDVALIPATIPLSSKVEVPNVVGVSHLVANPYSPPVTPAPIPPCIPRVEVATQRVEVPVDHSTWPTVPAVLIESLNNPESVRLVANTLVVVLLVSKALVAWRVVAVKAVEEASPRVVFPVTSKVEASVVAPVTLSKE